MVKAATVVAFAAMLLAGRTDIVFAQTAKPQRIVSINLCLDELALRLADPGVVVSVTWLSQDPRIADFVEEARKHPANSGAAEDVLDYRPDLVLAGDFMPKNTQDLLNHVGATVRRFEIPSTSAQARKLILEVGDAVDPGEGGG